MGDLFRGLGASLDPLTGSKGLGEGKEDQVVRWVQTGPSRRGREAHLGPKGSVKKPVRRVEDLIEEGKPVRRVEDVIPRRMVVEKARVHLLTSGQRKTVKTEEGEAN